MNGEMCDFFASYTRNIGSTVLYFTVLDCLVKCMVSGMRL